MGKIVEMGGTGRPTAAARRIGEDAAAAESLNRLALALGPEWRLSKPVEIIDEAVRRITDANIEARLMEVRRVGDVEPLPPEGNEVGQFKGKLVAIKRLEPPIIEPEPPK